MSISDQAFSAAYLSRIGWSGEIAPTLEYLTRLQVQHIYAVPFENLDLLAGIPVSLDREFLFRRIVEARRGGVCYELNRSFYDLLTALGYRADYVSGQVRLAGSLRDHALVLVHLEEGDYAVDVGFGDCVLPPLPLRHGVQCPAFGSVYSVARQGALYHLRRQRPGRLPQRMYTFTAEPRTIDDVMPRFRNAAIPGRSPFSTYPVCTWQRPDGRISLINKTLTVQTGSRRVTLPVETEAERARYLRQYFNLP